MEERIKVCDAVDGFRTQTCEYRRLKLETCTGRDLGHHGFNSSRRKFYRQHKFVFQVDVNDGRHESFHGVIEVLEKEYPTETIWLSGIKSGIHGTQKELDAVKVLVSNRTAKQYWDGWFRLPIQGEVTTEYGLKRCYNGVFASGYYHKGIDYGAPHGEPVWSPAAARVSLVGREEDGFALHGNCVGLDHGHGVTSILMHLDTILVEKGMVVQAGDLLGTVGDTGLATGPHLHWGLYVHGKAVDQNQWIREQSWLQ